MRVNLMNKESRAQNSRDADRKSGKILAKQTFPTAGKHLGGLG